MSTDSSREIKSNVGYWKQLQDEDYFAKHRVLFEALDAADRRQSLCDLWLQIGSSYALEGRFVDASRMALRGLRQRPIYTGGRLLQHAMEFMTLRLIRDGDHKPY